MECQWTESATSLLYDAGIAVSMDTRLGIIYLHFDEKEFCILQT